MHKEKLKSRYIIGNEHTGKYCIVNKIPQSQIDDNLYLFKSEKEAIFHGFLPWDDSDILQIKDIKPTQLKKILQFNKKYPPKNIFQTSQTNYAKNTLIINRICTASKVWCIGVLNDKLYIMHEVGDKELDLKFRKLNTLFTITIGLSPVFIHMHEYMNNSNKLNEFINPIYNLMATK